MEQPDVVRVVDVEPMVYFQCSKSLSPETPNLCCYINPQPFDPHIVDTSIISGQG